ncbi:MAG: hypothetical protein OEW85_05740, partial [Acidimicrobiia bacterium]|nr:hypothetical protein [Acidimicrobiia bacterium]
MTVTPDGALLDGQEVTVQGTGLPDVGIAHNGVQCVASLITPNMAQGDACDLSINTGAVFDTNPTFTGTMNVARIITVDGTTYDCGIVDGDQITITGSDLPTDAAFARFGTQCVASLIGADLIVGQCVASLIGPETIWASACSIDFVGAIGIFDAPFSNEPLLGIFTTPLQFAPDPLLLSVTPRLVGATEVWLVLTCSRGPPSAPRPPVTPSCCPSGGRVCCGWSRATASTRGWSTVR